MGHPHGFIELCLYGVLVGIAMPLIGGLFDILPVVAVGLAILLLLPSPIWLAGLRFSIPERIENALIWHSTIAWIAVFGTLTIMLLFALFNWVSQS